MDKCGEDEDAMGLDDSKPKPSMPARFRDLADASRLSPQQQQVEADHEAGCEENDSAAKGKEKERSPTAAEVK
ncbi:hypothetical protein FRC09_006866 [Ceratobasidium sp. 395]|nr:hypothetical protein FRC09_006866 [Ceratobasidium sp. 395]